MTGIKKFFFSTLWDCNQNCGFCAKGPKPAGAPARMPLSGCLSELKARRKEGFSALSLDGGEPTLRRDLPEMVSAALKAGYRWVRVTTNGVLLSDPAEVGRFTAIKPGKRLRFCVSLHAHSPKVSDGLTGVPGSFVRSVKGVDNLLAAGFDVALYHVITSQNYRGLPGFADFVRVRFGGRVKDVILSYIYPGPHSLARMPELYPKISSVRPYFMRALDNMRTWDARPRLSSCSIMPLCLMSGQWELFRDSFLINEDSATRDSSKQERYMFLREISNPDGKRKAPGCAACPLDPACGGIWKFYSDKYGTDELKPPRKGLPFPITRKGSAALTAPGPDGRAVLDILAARLRGFGKIRLSGGAAPLAPFARSLGMKTL